MNLLYVKKEDFILWIQSLARYKLSNRFDPLGQINSDPYSLDNNFFTMKEKKKKCILQISS